MRIGLVGPAEGNVTALREATELLVGELEVDQAIYLGTDDAVDRMVSTWSREIMGTDNPSEGFLDRAATLAEHGTPQDIESLLSADAQLQRLSCIHRLPPSPARAVEMIDDRIVLVVYDKRVLDEEDIANANVIVYGKSDEALLKQFGPRCFFTPGPLSGRKIGLLEVEESGRVAVAVYDPSGKAMWRETLQTRTAKLMVTG